MTAPVMGQALEGRGTVLGSAAFVLFQGSFRLNR